MSAALPRHTDETVDLPSVEAVLAGTMALMTGFAQSLQADAHPGTRELMGAKVSCQLGLLAKHAQLTEPFRRVLAGMQQRWELMAACSAAPAPADAALHARCPTRLQ